MPYYEYECDRCGVMTEMFYPSIPREIPEELTDRTCLNTNRGARCGGTFKKIMSRSTFHLKGGGWANHGYGPQLVDGSPIVSIDEPKE